MKKCPHGMYAEIKYDGERVQVHKLGEKFEYFSRSLKAVQPHKVVTLYGNSTCAYLIISVVWNSARGHS